jgi:hypothetical protein
MRKSKRDQIRQARAQKLGFVEDDALRNGPHLDWPYRWYIGLARRFCYVLSRMAGRSDLSSQGMVWFIRVAPLRPADSRIASAKQYRDKSNRWLLVTIGMGEPGNVMTMQMTQRQLKLLQRQIDHMIATQDLAFDDFDFE